MAFIGLPWPMKMTGMRRAGAAVRAVCACTWLARLCRVPSAAAAGACLEEIELWGIHRAFSYVTCVSN